MKRILCALPAILLVSCTESTNPSLQDPYIVKSKSFETKLGDKKVYGVQLHLFSPGNRNENRGYQVSLYQDEKVWIDTLYAELSPGDTLEGEIIFGEATVKEGSSISFKTQAFDIE